MSDDLNFLLGDGGRRYPAPIANRFVSHNFSSADGTNPFIMLSGGPNYLISYFRCQIDPITTVSGGGVVTVIWEDSFDGVVGNLRFFAPNAVGNPSNVTTTLQFGNQPGFYIASTSPHSTLTCRLDTALSAGQVRMIFRFITLDNGHI